MKNILGEERALCRIKAEKELFKNGYSYRYLHEVKSNFNINNFVFFEKLSNCETFYNKKNTGTRVVKVFQSKNDYIFYYIF